jgi:hypothetical protein
MDSVRRKLSTGKSVFTFGNYGALSVHTELVRFNLAISL